MSICRAPAVLHGLKVVSVLPRGLLYRHAEKICYPAFHCYNGAAASNAWLSTINQRKPFHPAVAAVQFRNIHTSKTLWDTDPLKPSSKVEESVLAIKEDLKKDKPSSQVNHTVPTTDIKPQKPSIGKRIMDELKHYYHGFRLLFIDVKISWKYLMRVLKGDALTRREKKQLLRTSADVFRLVPFSVFIIVPFMEFTLPIFLKLFPNMLPSTFQTANEKEAKTKTALKVKLEMAKFLQQTLDEMALKGSGPQSGTAKQFAEFFNKVRNSGDLASNEEILRFSKLFEDEITLDSLTRPQLQALCRVLEISPVGPSSVLRFQLRMRLRSLAADDKVIQKEGVDFLTVTELQAACRARGMRSLGVSEIRLKSQLRQWLDLSLNERVPPSLLLLSRALYLPDSDVVSDQLKATIASLPESVAAQTQDAISQRRGRVDNEARILALKLEEEAIAEERKEKVVLTAPGLIKAAAEQLIDVAPELKDKAPVLPTTPEQLTSADVAALENALESIGVQRKRLLIEKEELTELKEELAEYQEDIEELKDFIDASAQQLPTEQQRVVLRESKAAKRLFRAVNRMINKLDGTVDRLESKAARKDDEFAGVAPETEEISIEELIASIRRLQAVENSAKLQQIVQMLAQIDQDRDGIVQIDDVLKVIELLGHENIQMTPKQVTEILNLVTKEEILEMEQKVTKALGQAKMAAAHAAAAAVNAALRGGLKVDGPAESTPPDSATKKNNH